LAVPLIAAASKPVLGAALSPPALAAGAADPVVGADGAGVAPEVQAPAIITIEAPRANRLRRMRVLLRLARRGLLGDLERTGVQGNVGSP
jgi:hypothetical protein